MKVFTYGASHYGVGVYSVIVENGNKDSKIMKNFFSQHRAELLAAIEGISMAPNNVDLELLTSKYVATNASYWHSDLFVDDENADLWKALREISDRREIQWIYVE
jgi:ribonuclease HI